MFKNYFKIAIAVLKRRKFFTFISLFGISFTLTILMVGTAFLDKIVSADYPDYKRDRSLYLTRVEMSSSKVPWININPLSFYLLDHYIAKLKMPEKIAISSNSMPTNTYVNNKKIVLDYKYTNADYWDVMEYQFVEGKPFSKQQIDRAERVAVISEGAKLAYFGSASNVVGKYIEADNVSYRITGVVENVSKTMHLFYGDLYLPYTVSKSNYREVTLNGEYNAVLLAKSKQEVPAMLKEYNELIAKVPTMDKELDLMTCNADTYVESVAREFFGDSHNNGIKRMTGMLVTAVFLFLLLPTINLININTTRIMERSSEIGVRKAFGASSRTLVYQFIVENLILTFIGGIVGVILSFIALKIINASDLITNLHLSLNFFVLGYGFLACIFFGFLSGVYPAWRMSRLNVVSALKAQ